jgi:ATPases involved in chromosome partitioning
MSQECEHNCESCQEDCDERSFLAPMNAHSHVKKVIGIVSGKGGVGKSSITSLLTVLKQREGYKVAVLDGDITGPSIAKAFGVEGTQLYSNGQEIIPAQTAFGTKIISTNLLLDNPEEPVVWRGPILAGMVKQFWSDVLWGEIDYMFVDMPPGTGDVPLTVFQSLPIDGIVIVTSPQELVGMIVEKAVNMARKMNIPILGIVENMSYVECPSCGQKIYVFGKSHLNDIADKYDLKILGKLPLDSELTKLSDLGMIEDYQADWLDELQEALKDI